MPSRTVLRQIVGTGLQEIISWLQEIESRYGDASSANEVIDAIVQARATSQSPEELFDLIISGPEVADVPTCETITTIHDLIYSARKDILICDYAIYGAESIFIHLASAKEKRPDLRIRLVLHVFEDDKGKQGRLERFASELIQHHWKSSVLPEVYIDPRNLDHKSGFRTSMHAKCFVADQNSALITSANLTDAAHQRNIEAGVIVRYPGLVKRLVRYFDGLIEEGYLEKLMFSTKNERHYLAGS